jgi:hypothetical protein
MEIRKRLSEWKGMLGMSWRWLVLTPSALLGLYQEVQRQFVPSLPSSIPLSPVWWLVITLALTCILVLEGAYRRVRELTPRNIRAILNFNEVRPDYKRINGDEETYAIGFSAIGGKIEDPEVFVHSLFENKPMPRLSVYVPTKRLTPAVGYKIKAVNPGITSTYFVNVFMHKIGQKQIKFCHFNYTSEPIPLTAREWELVLRGRGSNTPENDDGVIRLLLTLDENGNLEVKRERVTV